MIKCLTFALAFTTSMGEAYSVTLSPSSNLVEEIESKGIKRPFSGVTEKLAESQSVTPEEASVPLSKTSNGVTIRALSEPIINSRDAYHRRKQAKKDEYHRRKAAKKDARYRRKQARKAAQRQLFLLSRGLVPTTVERIIITHLLKPAVSTDVKVETPSELTETPTPRTKSAEDSKQNENENPKIPVVTPTQKPPDTPLIENKKNEEIKPTTVNMNSANVPMNALIGGDVLNSNNSTMDVDIHDAMYESLRTELDKLQVDLTRLESHLEAPKIVAVTLDVHKELGNLISNFSYIKEVSNRLKPKMRDTDSYALNNIELQEEKIKNLEQSINNAEERLALLKSRIEVFYPKIESKKILAKDMELKFISQADPLETKLHNYMSMLELLNAEIASVHPLLINNFDPDDLDIKRNIIINLQRNSSHIEDEIPAIDIANAKTEKSDSNENSPPRNLVNILKEIVKQTKNSLDQTNIQLATQISSPLTTRKKTMKHEKGEPTNSNGFFKTEQSTTNVSLAEILTPLKTIVGTVLKEFVGLDSYLAELKNAGAKNLIGIITPALRKNLETIKREYAMSSSDSNKDEIKEPSLKSTKQPSDDVQELNNILTTYTKITLNPQKLASSDFLFKKTQIGMQVNTLKKQFEHILSALESASIKTENLPPLEDLAPKKEAQTITDETQTTSSEPILVQLLEPLKEVNSDEETKQNPTSEPLTETKTEKDKIPHLIVRRVTEVDEIKLDPEILRETLRSLINKVAELSKKLITVKIISVNSSGKFTDNINEIKTLSSNLLSNLTNINEGYRLHPLKKLTLLQSETVDFLSLHFMDIVLILGTKITSLLKVKIDPSKINDGVFKHWVDVIELDVRNLNQKFDEIIKRAESQTISSPTVSQQIKILNLQKAKENNPFRNTLKPVVKKDSAETLNLQNEIGNNYFKSTPMPMPALVKKENSLKDSMLNEKENFGFFQLNITHDQ